MNWAGHAPHVSICTPETADTQDSLREMLGIEAADDDAITYIAIDDVMALHSPLYDPSGGFIRLERTHIALGHAIGELPQTV